MILKYNGEDKEFVTELERGEIELDMLTDDNINLEDTIKIKSINLEDTLELNNEDLNKINEGIINNE